MHSTGIGGKLHYVERRGAGIALAAMLAMGAGAEQNQAEVKPEQREALKAEIGTALAAKPQKARRVLVFWRCEGFVHAESIAVGNEAFRIAAEQTKAFSVDFSKEYADLKAENLARYDALVLNNTTMMNTKANPFISPALIDFVRSGKGLTVIHAGADNFYDSRELAEMVGGLFWGHPWHAGGTWAFKIEDAANPLNAPFAGKNFKQGDEIYMQQSPYYNRAKLHVLVSLDFSDPATAGTKGQKRADGDYAVSWIRPYGKGRVFYTSFGHDARAWLARPTLLHIFNGLQYTLGDLKADDAPAGFTAADIGRMKANNEQSEVFSEAVNTLAAIDSPELRKANIEKLAAILSDGAATPFAKHAVLRAMTALGTPKSLDGIVKCLGIPETRNDAISLLANTRSDAADAALAAAWAAADSGERCSLVSAFALRGESAPILAHAEDSGKDVAYAAILALGRVADAKSLAFLSKPRDDPHAEDLRQAALSDCLGNLASRGELKKASAAAKPVFADAKLSPMLRAAAARVLVMADSGFLKTAMRDADPAVRGAAIRSASDASERQLADALAAAATARDKAAIVSRLAANNAHGAAGAIAACLASPDADAVLAALEALKKLGGKNEIPAIAALLDRGGRIGEAAFQTLSDIPAAGAGQAIFKLAETNARLIPVLGERMEAALLPEWQGLVSSKDDGIRKDAWKALGKMAAPATLPLFCKWFAGIQDSEKTAAANALTASARNADDGKRTELFAGIWKNGSVPAKIQLAGLMAQYPCQEFEKLLATALNNDAEEFAVAAADALGRWNGIAPFDALKAAYASAKDGARKQEFLRAALKLAAAQAGKEYDAKMAELFKAADGNGQKRIADAMFRAESLKAFPALQALFGDAAAGTAAKREYVRLSDSQVKGKAAIAANFDRGKWKARASHNSREANRAFDGNASSRWSSNVESARGMWYILDLGESAFVSEIILHTEESVRDTPNGWEAYVSQDGKSWGAPAAAGDGNTTGKTAIALNASARQIKIVTTGGRNGLHWSIHEIEIKGGLDPKTAEAIMKTADSVR